MVGTSMIDVIQPRQNYCRALQELGFCLSGVLIIGTSVRQGAREREMSVDAGELAANVPSSSRPICQLDR